MVTIRRFEPEDQKSVQKLIASIMSDEFKEDQAAYPTADIDNVQTSYGNLGEAFFVAINGKKVVGTVGIKKEDDRVALMRRLFVARDHRKQSIGIKLIDRVLQFCDEVGYDEVIFKTTSRMEAACKTCQKKGFIQRAKLQLGSIELLKYSHSLHSHKEKK